MKNNIVLVGMPGSGKTTIGIALKDRLNCKFYDLDNLIETRENKKITEIFAQNGEKYFRNLETKIIKKIENETRVVLSTGGGTFESPENRELLLKFGKIFYLEIKPDIIFKRIKEDKTRPLLQKNDPEGILFDMYEKRKENYKKADYTVNADNNKEIITDWIIKKYEEING